MDQTTALNEAMAAIRLGDLSKGKQLLTRVLNRDPQNEMALLWMTQVVTDDQRRMEYLDRVLEVNPANKQAQKGREVIEQRLLGNIKAKDLLQEAEDRLDSGNQDGATRVLQANGPEEGNGPSRHRSGKGGSRLFLFPLLIGVFVCTGGGLIWWSLLRSPSESQERSASASPEPFVRYEIVGVYRASSVSYGDEQAEAAGEFVIVSINASDYGDVPAELSFSSFCTGSP